MSYFRDPKLNSDKNLQAYVIGLALGDGNLSNPNNRAVRLRITCDKKYPLLIDRICDSLAKLLPENKISYFDKGNCIDISAYSKHFEKLLGWKAKGGLKFIQKFSIPKWIKQNSSFAIECLRGLLETDGSIYMDRGYRMANFVTIIPSLSRDVSEIINNLGFKAHVYKIDQKKN